MKIFLTGATGYIGSVVAEKLLAEGYSVLGLSRSEASDEKLIARGIEPHRGNLDDPQSLAVGVHLADGVIHTAFGSDLEDYDGLTNTDFGAVQAMMTALEDKNRTIVVTSAGEVLGDSGDAVLDESAPVDEDSLFASRANVDRLALEGELRGIRSVVIRLPLFVYGRGGSGFVPAQLEAAREVGEACYIDAGENRFSSVHVEDAATAFVLALRHAPAGSLYHLSDGFDASARQIAEAVASNLGLSANSVTREGALEIFGPSLTTFFEMNNRLNPQKAISELGWKPEERMNILEDIASGSYKRGAPGA